MDINGDIQNEVINGNVNPYDLLDLWNEKPLDRSDIESLGFTWQSEGNGRNEYYIVDNKSIYITHRPPLISIDVWDADSDRSIIKSSIVDSVIIKNKSELKRILKQIGI